jgi:hypothetical protein
VAGEGHRELVHLDADGGVLGRYGGLQYPHAVVIVSSDNSAWVSDLTGDLRHFAADGSILWQAKVCDEAHGMDFNPADNTLWVSDYFGGTLLHLAADGTQLWSGGELSAPSAVKVSVSDGSVWVIESLLIGTPDDFRVVSRLVHYSAEGVELLRGGGLSSPRSISLNQSDGSVWVADTDQASDGQVVHLTADGSVLSQTGGLPEGAVACSPADGKCWVAFEGGLALLGADGAELWRKAMPTRLRDLSVNALDGTCWVHDGYDLTLFAPDGTVLWTEEAWDTTTLWEASSIAVSPGDGSLWVVSEVNAQLERYTYPPYQWPPFVDISPDFWASGAIAAVAEAGIVFGYGDGTYRPEAVVDRAQVAVYLARWLAGGDEAVPAGPEVASFADVPVTHWAYRHVEYARELGVTQGYADGYHPDEPVDRGQMAAYISRAVAGGDAAVPPGPTAPTFQDVPVDYWAYRYVEYAAAQGLVVGFGDGYRPAAPVDRAQMAVFISRAISHTTE